MAIIQTQFGKKTHSRPDAEGSVRRYLEPIGGFERLMAVNTLKALSRHPASR